MLHKQCLAGSFVVASPIDEPTQSSRTPGPVREALGLPEAAHLADPSADHVCANNLLILCDVSVSVDNGQFLLV